LGIEPKTIEYTGNDPLAFVLSKNLHRRHLSESQRAMIAEELANMRHGGDRKSGENQAANLRLDPQGESIDCPTSGKGTEDSEPSANLRKVNKGNTARSGAISQSAAAKMLNVSERQVQNAAKLRREAAPEVVEQVKRGEKSIHAALSKQTSAKQPPRRKTVAKEPEPEGKFIQVEKRWEKEIATWTEWWDKMPTAYQQLTDGETLTGCMQVPIPFNHNVLMAMFRKMCDDAGDTGIRDSLIAEVKLLAERIDELND
jgi:hypothetical protein